jgi:predicted phage-related endonuclease
MIDLSKKNLGCKLPEEIAHLEEFARYAKQIKEEVYGFFIPQFVDGKRNEDWYSFRKNTIGSSEVATLLDLDEYGDPVKLFRSKVDYDIPPFASKFTVNGLHFEEKISDLWEFHDGTELGWVDNWTEGKKIRKKIEIPCYAININYPHISASLDFYIPGGQVSPFTGEVVESDASLEIKMVSQFASDKYELGIPHRYVVQTNLQMIVLGLTYSEIAYLVAGVDFNVLPLDMDLELCQEIVVKTYDFWKRVTMAKDILNTEGSDELEKDREITNLEPEPSGNISYIEFYKDKYKTSIQESFRLGTDEEWQMAVSYKNTTDKISQLEKSKEKEKQNIMAFSRYDEIISFEDNGRILNKRPEGKRATFRVNIKNYKEV